MQFDPGAIGGSGWIFLLFQGAYIPWRAWKLRARRAAEEAQPSRAAPLTSALVSLAILLLVSLVAAYFHHMELYPLAWPTAVGWLQAAFTLVAMLVLVWPRLQKAVAKPERGDSLMPRGPDEQRRWVALSAMTALVEETAYRGVTFSLLLWVSGSMAFATVVSAASYALAHLQESRLAMAIVFVHGVLLQLLMIQSGSLYLPMLVHFLYAVIAGFMTVSSSGSSRT